MLDTPWQAVTPRGDGRDGVPCRLRGGDVAIWVVDQGGVLEARTSLGRCWIYWHWPGRQCPCFVAMLPDTARRETSKTRPQIRRDYPPNLSILLSGGR